LKLLLNAIQEVSDIGGQTEIDDSLSEFDGVKADLETDIQKEKVKFTKDVPTRWDIRIQVMFYRISVKILMLLSIN